jgi:hypothetical protein
MPIAAAAARHKIERRRRARGVPSAAARLPEARRRMTSGLEVAPRSTDTVIRCPFSKS